MIISSKDLLFFIIGTIVFDSNASQYGVNASTTSFTLSSDCPLKLRSLTYSSNVLDPLVNAIAPRMISIQAFGVLMSKTLSFHL